MFIMSALFDALLLLVYAVVLAAFIAFLSLTVFLWRLHKKYEHLPGPKRDSFYLGNFPELNRRLAKGNTFSGTLYDWCLDHGHTYVLFMIHKAAVVTVDPEGVKNVLITEGFPKAPEFYEPFHSLYGIRFVRKSLFCDLNDDSWHARRVILDQAFSRNLLKPMMGEFNYTADQLMEHLSEMADGKTVVCLLDKLHRTTLDVIGKVAYGMDIDSLRDDNCPIPAALSKTLQGYQVSVNNPLDWLTPFLRREFKQEVRDACLLLRKVAHDRVKERRDAIKKEEFIPDDVLNYIMKTYDAYGDGDEEIMADDVISFFVGGQETTANTLAFSLMELGRHPEIFAKLRAEVDEVLGDRSEVEFTDLNKLNYCNLVMKETLRMYPPVPGTIRNVNRDGFKIDGYLIPNGTNVLTNMFVSGRHPDFHALDSSKFLPERFANEDTKPMTHVAYPFSLGPRNCIGQNFARMESKVLLAKFVQRFDMKLDPNQSFDINESGTLRPKGGTMITLTFRE